jgi:YD repeat-containing protein
MRLLIILIFLTTIFGCEKQKEQVEKFVFDNKQISTKDIYRYEFDGNGRIKTTYSTNFMYMAGVPFDSTTYVKRYEYNDKGQIARIFDTIDSTWQTKFYNELDSLIADYTINNYGDTTRMTTLDYTNGKTHKKVDRMLRMKLLDNFENVKKEDLRNYDTMLFITEFVYDGDQHVKSLSFDKDGTLTEEVNLIYENGQKAKTITYSFLGDSKFISETTVYNDNEEGDFGAVTIGTQGDTTGFQKTIIQERNKIKINYMKQFNMQDIAYYDKKGWLIGTVLVDFNEKVKTVYSYTYDDKGNVTEEATYRERVNNAR